MTDTTAEEPHEDVSPALEPLSAKAFDFAQDTTKQVLTLATGTVALTITFLNGRLAEYSSVSQHILEFSWLSYFVSIFFGIVTLQALSGNLERPNDESKMPQIYAWNIRFPALLQLLTFLIGTGLVGWFAYRVVGVRVSGS